MHHPGPSLQFETGLTDRWHSIGYAKISSGSACEPNTSLLYDESHFYVAAVSFFFFFPQDLNGCFMLYMRSLLDMATVHGYMGCR